MPTSPMIKYIGIEVAGETMNLTVEEAQKLYDDLFKVFGRPLPPGTTWCSTPGVDKKSDADVFINAGGENWTYGRADFEP